MARMDIGVEGSLPSHNWLDAAQARIDAQAEIVNSLEPGSKAHRMASEVLLTLQDSLHVMSEAHAMLALARRFSPPDREL